MVATRTHPRPAINDSMNTVIECLSHFLETAIQSKGWSERRYGEKGDERLKGIKKKKACGNKRWETRAEEGSRIRHRGREIRRVIQVWGSMGKGSASKDIEERDCISPSSQWTWLHSQVDGSESCRPSAFFCAWCIIP